MNTLVKTISNKNNLDMKRYIGTSYTFAFGSGKKRPVVCHFSAVANLKLAKKMYVCIASVYRFAIIIQMIQ